VSTIATTRNRRRRHTCPICRAKRRVRRLRRHVEQMLALAGLFGVTLLLAQALINSGTWR
jgi:hypothetical protein